MRVIDKVAWLLLADGMVLCARSRGKLLYYLPGGKREPGESDVETLVREIAEELAVDITAPTASHAGTFEARADGHDAGVLVRMACYTAAYTGIPQASSEIADVRWLGYADRDQVAAVDQLIFDHLHAHGQLR